MTPAYPYTEQFRDDTVALPFRDEIYAMMVAMILERMTGEKCEVLKAHHSQRVMRRTGERWLKA